MLGGYDRWLLRQADEAAVSCDEESCERRGNRRRLGTYCDHHFDVIDAGRADYAHELARERALMEDA